MTRFVAPRELFRSGKLLVFIGAGTSDATIRLRGEHFPGQKEIDETFQIRPASRDPNGDEIDRRGARPRANQLVRVRDDTWSWRTLPKEQVSRSGYSYGQLSPAAFADVD